MKVYAIDKYLQGNQAFPVPPKAKRKSKKSITFGNLISENEASKHIGFVYFALLNDRCVYVGSKQFTHGADWRTYTTSSKVVKQRIKEGCSVTWKVLEFVDSSNRIKGIESKWIYMYAQDRRVNLVNKVDAQGNRLATGKQYKNILTQFTQIDNT